MIIIILVIILVCPSFLSINKPISSKNLIVDSWLSARELEDIVDLTQGMDLQKVIIVGKYFTLPVDQEKSIVDYQQLKFSKWKNRRGVLLLTNSSLIIDLSKFNLQKHGEINEITLRACDTQKNRVFAHFNISLNGNTIGESFVTDTLQDYFFQTSFPLSENGILSVYFDNDYYSESESRNLYIDSISINGFGISINNINCMLTKEKDKLTTGFISDAEQTASYLQTLKVNQGVIDIVEFELVGRNQTLTAANSVNEFLKNSSITDVNVTSAGLHGRRSFFTYKKILDENIQVGIINSEYSKYNQSNWYKTQDGIIFFFDELFSYVVIWMKLVF